MTDIQLTGANYFLYKSEGPPKVVVFDLVDNDIDCYISTFLFSVFKVLRLGLLICFVFVFDLCNLYEERR